MPQWFLPYTAAALVAAALGWLATSYDPDAGRETATPALAGAPAPGNPGAQPTSNPAPATNAGNLAPAPAPAPAGAAEAPAPAPTSSPGDEADVRRLVTLALTTDRAADCSRFYTPAFQAQLKRKPGPEAMAECREEADGEADGTRAHIKSLSPVAGGYQVAASASGGEMGPVSFVVTVISAHGGWKIDHLVSVDFNMNRLGELMVDHFLEKGWSPAEAQCMGDKIAAMDEDDFSDAWLGAEGNPLQEVVEREFQECMSGSTLRDQMATGIRQGLADQGAPAPIIDCVVDSLLGGRSDAEIRAMMDQLYEGSSPLKAEAAEATEACAAAAGYVN